MPADIAARLARIHRGREPERLAIKLRRMAESPFAFLRGTPRLFYEDWPKRDPLHRAPRAWLCGDLHLENFGTYRADNGLTYFDINDFDEGSRGPVTWDLARFAASAVLECRRRGFPTARQRALLNHLIDAYALQIIGGKARWIERETATGLIRELFDHLAPKRRADLLAKRTAGSRLRVDGEKAIPLLDGQIKTLEQFASSQLSGFRLLDAARRIAGNSSLGWPRFVLFVETPSRERRLIDLKFAPDPVPPAVLRSPQPEWRSNSHRVVETQAMMQAIPHALLSAVQLDGRPYILRELLPQEDRVKIAKATHVDFEHFILTLAAAAAWAHLRASGRRDSATADQLGEFAARKDWRTLLRNRTLGYATLVEKQWREFVAATSSSGS